MGETRWKRVLPGRRCVGGNALEARFTRTGEECAFSKPRPHGVGEGQTPQDRRFVGLFAARPSERGLLSLPKTWSLGVKERKGSVYGRRSDASRIRHGETGRLAAPWGREREHWNKNLNLPPCARRRDMIYYLPFSTNGEVAQLVEHHVRNVGVESSNLFFSTNRWKRRKRLSPV